MADLIKNLIVKSVYLGLYLTVVLAAHFGVLSLVYDDFFKEVLMTADPLFATLYSILALSLFCVFVFLPGFIPRAALALDERKRFIALSSITTALLLILLYSSFFQTEAIYKITASAVLFAVIIAFIAFCDFEKPKTAWKKLQRGLTAALLFTLPFCLYIKPETVPMLALLLKNTQISPVESQFKARERLIDTAFYDVHLTEYYLQDYNISYLLRGGRSHIDALDNQNFLGS